MSKGKFTIDVKFTDIFPKICQHLQTESQTKIAKHFDKMTPSAITNFKSQNTFPMNRVVEFSRKSGIPVEALLTKDVETTDINNKSILRELSDEQPHKRRLEDKYYIFLRILNREGRLEAQKMQFLKVLALKDWVTPQLKGNPENAFMTVMEGDSMDGTISSGDILFCDGLNGKLSDIPIEDSIYVISLDGNVPMIRRLQVLPNREVKVIADNPKYDSFSITKDYDCNILGQVLWVTKKT